MKYILIANINIKKVVSNIFEVKSLTKMIEETYNDNREISILKIATMGPNLSNSLI